MKNWIQGICFGLAMLCLMSWLDDDYEVKQIESQELIEARHAARLELADRKIESAYLMAKAGNMTNAKGIK